MVDLEVRELRYFQAVAQELNFSRAAERLGIAQPPLSRAIRQLERRVGTQLFERDNRRVALTAAGAVLMDEATQVFNAISAAALRTRRAAAASPALVVTAKPMVTTDLLRRILEAYGPDPGLEVVISGFGEQADLVRDGRADVALLGLPGDHRGLDLQVLTSEPRVAALPTGHPLAGRAGLSRHDLAGLPFPRCRETSPAERSFWGGDDPADGPVIQDSSQLLEAVALGQAVALIPASLAARNRRDDIAYRPVPDACPYEIAAGWPAGSRNPAIAHFVETALGLATAGRPSERSAQS
ncbi:LysR family transcriptional regulator [Fodinicola feengrottensis]|uniref:LysR family transcriptional regulator n=1 Tax=Fodinicola feengrottensis TaxID=435914 RepID=A0ABN2FPN2_9ACTN|nr:LysR family transcriptional regulator [Fodinicola feengrottensis]